MSYDKRINNQSAKNSVVRVLEIHNIPFVRKETIKIMDLNDPNLYDQMSEKPCGDIQLEIIQTDLFALVEKTLEFPQDCDIDDIIKSYIVLPEELSAFIENGYREVFNED
jgi:hypothetical protein